MTTISGQWNEVPGAVTLIDAHHHLWDLKANRYPFLSDQPEPQLFVVIGPAKLTRYGEALVDLLSGEGDDSQVAF